MGKTAIQGEQLNIINNEMTIVLSENIEWLWLCLQGFNLPMIINAIPKIIRMEAANGSAMVSVYFAM